jgi:hypothetical protein
MNDQRLVFLASVVSLSALLGACASPSPTQTPPVVSSTACESATALSDRPLDSTFMSDRVIGGGTVQTEGFQFEAYLYCDPALLPTAAAPESMSSIAGIGVHTAWRYDGADLPGPVLLEWGFGHEPHPSGGWDGGLTRGSMGSFTGGINLPEAPSDISQRIPIEVSFAVTAQGVHAGAVLTFELVPSADGYIPTNLQFETQP